MKKLIIAVLGCLLLLSGCATPMIEIATSNHHIESGSEGHTNLWNALYKNDKTFRYGDEKEADYISYQLTPVAFEIKILDEIPEDAPTGIQMLVMAPKDAQFIKVHTSDMKNDDILDEVDILKKPVGLFESRMSVERAVFVVNYLGKDLNNDGEISGEELREIKDSHKATIAFYDLKGKKIGQESFDVKIIKEN